MAFSAGNVGSVSLHEEFSTPFILRRNDARWSSGDHLSGAAACARSPHFEQVVLRPNAWHVRHCCRI